MIAISEGHAAHSTVTRQSMTRGQAPCLYQLSPGRPTVRGVEQKHASVILARD